MAPVAELGDEALENWKDYAIARRAIVEAAARHRINGRSASLKISNS